MGFAVIQLLETVQSSVNSDKKSEKIVDIWYKSNFFETHKYISIKYVTKHENKIESALVMEIIMCFYNDFIKLLYWAHQEKKKSWLCEETV